MAARVWDRPGESLCDHDLSRTICTPGFRVSPEPDIFAPANVADGHIRPCGLPHLWRSAPMHSGRCETLTLTWPQAVTVRQVELVFDSQLHGEPRGIAATLVRDYDLVADADGREVILARGHNNTLRFMVHRCEPTRTPRLELRIHSTHGAPHAAVYAVRVYG
jgi:hypothetical protein